MRPLLWKEMRDLRAWVAAGALLVGAVELLIRSEHIRVVWASTIFEVFMPLLLAVAAVGLGAGQIARERQTRTLEYLLVRPVPPGMVIWSKFLAGTAALALLAPAIVALGFLYREPTETVLAHSIQQQAGFPGMAMALFPRYWCLYALALFCSVLVDRSVKVAAVMVVVVITVPALALHFEMLAPFSGFVYWLPFIDGSMGLVLAAKNAAILWLTGTVFGGAALLLAAAAAALLKRSPERYVGNLGLAAIAAGIVGAAVLSAHGASVRVPATAPAGSLAVGEAEGMVASGSMVAVLQDAGVRFYDFSQAAHPREVAFVPLPLWTTESAWNVTKACMADGAVFVVGQKKGLPVDQEEVAIIRPAAPVEEVALGPVRPKENFFPLVPVGQFLYLGVCREDHCRIRVFDIASRREVASVPVEGRPPMAACRRGSYFYVASPSTLTTIDVRNPAEPVVAGSRAIRPRLMLSFPLQLTWQDDRLFELAVAPPSLEAFSLKDPSHPAAQSSLEFRDIAAISGSGRALYRPWQRGVLEFRAEGGGLDITRYLSGNRAVSAIAVDGARIFALTTADDFRRRLVQAFQLNTDYHKER